MITVVMGHRGVGKSALLQRVQSYRKAAVIFDLDSLIEEDAKTSIQEIFESKGEGEFRKLEKKVFRKLLSQLEEQGQNELTFISVGAGFDVSEIPPRIHRLWLRRKTDLSGRIFLDRPSLEPDLSPLDEYRKRSTVREEKFLRVYDEELTLPEGLDQENSAEEQFFTQSFRDLSGVLTLLPENFRSAEKWRAFIDKRLQWGLDYFEVRDDLLEPDQVEAVFQSVPFDKIIYSFRKRNGLLPDPEKLSKVALWDWPLELGPCPFGSPSIVSIHEREPNESIEAAILRLEQAAPKGSFLKLAVHTHNFSELETGYRWMRNHSSEACFLPRSLTGRWSWFRLLMKGHFPINFFREGMGSAIDQPHLLEWATTPNRPRSFAAVLGFPVLHSRTPMEHQSFFAAQERPVFAIPIGEPEWEAGIKMITELGLHAAAVTSPLKRKAFDWVEQKTAEAEHFRAVNTLVFKDQSWRGHSTDFLGLKALLANIEADQKVVVWGGGGVLSQVRERLPQASFYSARTGRPREGQQELSPDLVIWAAPRAKEYQWPPEEWSPKQVIDLNYREDSSGREYALRAQAEYVSGLKMFEVQAEAQRQFWKC